MIEDLNLTLSWRVSLFYIYSLNKKGLHHAALRQKKIPNFCTQLFYESLNRKIRVFCQKELFYQRFAWLFSICEGESNILIWNKKNENKSKKKCKKVSGEAKKSAQRQIAQDST